MFFPTLPLVKKLKGEKMKLGVSTTEIMQTEMGKDFVEARQKAESLEQHYKENEIGEQEVIAWNSYKLKNGKSPYAEAIEKAFNKMLERVIPEDAILSTRFQNWITKERNTLMVDTKINKDKYFREQVDYETGIITTNLGNALIQAKMDYLNNKLAILEKSFKKHMADNPEIAFASKEQLEKWQNYYASQAQKVNQILESGDYSYYDKKDKEGNVIKEGTEEDALRHQEHIGNLMNKIDGAQAEQENRVNNTQPQQTEAQMDYVGDALEQNKPKYRQQ